MLRVPLSVLVMLLSTACTGGDQRSDRHEPTLNRYAQLYTDVQDAFLHSSELADPKTVGQANRHYGFNGDSPVRVVQWEDRGVHTFCIVNRETGTYYFRNTRWEFLGDGDCSRPRADAVVVHDGSRSRWVRGVDLIRPVVYIRDPKLRHADPVAYVEPIAQVLERRVKDGGRVPARLTPALVRRLGVRMTHHHEVAVYRTSRSGRAFVLCVVHRPSGAWSLFDSSATLPSTPHHGSFVGVGDSGATCEPDPDSLIGG